jgi:hypothetical protein
MTTEDEKKDICSQVDDKNQKVADNDQLLSNLFNVIRSQNSNKTREENNILIDDEDRDDDEEDDDEDDEDDEDHRWDALNKLLDSHLQITKALLHLVKEK